MHVELVVPDRGEPLTADLVFAASAAVLSDRAYRSYLDSASSKLASVYEDIHSAASSLVLSYSYPVYCTAFALCAVDQDGCCDLRP